ncbi:transporter substrate-binding domain-containing protein [Brevibacterium sp. RIT 803]|nr:transporter substrate-binding domain-containing protein [Brevibacterium sp. RIT 803]MBM6590330.1 hypothetical protein [Brevibacterium sp. RIT 803]
MHRDAQAHSDEQGYAVRLGDEEMLQYVNTWLHIVKNDGTNDKAEESWFG